MSIEKIDIFQVHDWLLNAEQDDLKIWFMKKKKHACMDALRCLT